jgi:hypothetical protein
MRFLSQEDHYWLAGMDDMINSVKENAQAVVNLMGSVKGRCISTEATIVQRQARVTELDGVVTAREARVTELDGVIAARVAEIEVSDSSCYGWSAFSKCMC